MRLAVATHGSAELQLRDESDTVTHIFQSPAHIAATTRPLRQTFTALVPATHCSHAISRYP